MAVTRPFSASGAAPNRTRLRLCAVGVVFSAVMGLGVVTLTSRIDGEHDRRQTTERRLVSLAAPVAEACARPGRVAAELGDVCAAAVMARDSAGTTPLDDEAVAPALPTPPPQPGVVTRLVLVPAPARTVTEPNPVTTSPAAPSSTATVPTVVLAPPVLTETRTVVETVTVTADPPPAPPSSSAPPEPTSTTVTSSAPPSPVAPPPAG